MRGRLRFLAVTLILLINSALLAQVGKPSGAFTFTFNRFVEKDSLKFVNCTLRNTSDSIFWILAYDTTHSKSGVYIRPVFSVKEKKNGDWKITDLGFSGIGIEAFGLYPGEQYEFETPDFDTSVDAVMIGIDVRIRSGADKLRTIRELWTDEIALKATAGRR
ncbi:MAG: hypothetical protein ABI778_05895 [Ignavibacteriota bacterium]